MYRIELRPGEETALRTIEELAIGIRNGVITPRARIWHNAGQKWLPIEFHPHYRAACQQLEGGDESESESVATISTLMAMPAPRAAAVESNVALTSAPVVEADRPAVAPAMSRNRSMGRPIGLFAAGCVIIAGAKLAMSSTPLDMARANATDTRAAESRPAEVSRQISALPATTAALAEPAAPIRKTVIGGGVVRGPTQVSPPTPPVSHREVAADTIPSAPPIPALHLTLPPAEKPASEAAATQDNPDFIAR